VIFRERWFDVLLNAQGWFVGRDRVQRIWRREGLKLPKKQKPRGRLWLNDGSCVRLRPEQPNHVWSHDFASARTHDGGGVRMLTLIDEFTREALAIRVARRLNRINVIETLADAMLIKGVPEYIRSDNGPEITAKIVRNRPSSRAGALRFRSQHDGCSRGAHASDLALRTPDFRLCSHGIIDEHP
jgi:transposase InsO family protein